MFSLTPHILPLQLLSTKKLSSRVNYEALSHHASTGTVSADGEQDDGLFELGEAANIMSHPQRSKAAAPSAAPAHVFSSLSKNPSNQAPPPVGARLASFSNTISKE